MARGSLVNCMLRVGVTVRIIFIESCMLLVAAHLVSGEIHTPPPADAIVKRVSEARAEDRARAQSFEVIRTYQLFGKERQDSKSEVSADIVYRPDRVPNYTIHRVLGAPLGETIVRKILEKEKEVIRNPALSDFSPDNYLFLFLREESLNNRPCYLLALRPKRKDTRLLFGTAWIDAASYRVLKVEGEPAQAVSWWIHNVHITLEFQEVHGMWLQTNLRSTADVRLLGPHMMVSRDVEYRMGNMEATVRPTSH